MKMITQIYINNFNLLTWPKAMLEYLQQLPGCEVTIIDNASNYEPLLDWYASNPCRLVRLDQNMGHTAPWHSGQIGADHPERYVVTDPDLDISSVPLDIIDRLAEGIARYPWAIKCGLSLDLDNLPEHPLTVNPYDWEKQYWVDRLDNEFYRANTDTTFALYNPATPPQPGVTYSSIRSDKPYCARHLPWFETEEDPSEEYINYLKTAGVWSHSSGQYKTRYGG